MRLLEKLHFCNSFWRAANPTLAISWWGFLLYMSVGRDELSLNLTFKVYKSQEHLFSFLVIYWCGQGLYLCTIYKVTFYFPIDWNAKSRFSKDMHGESPRKHAPCCCSGTFGHDLWIPAILGIKSDENWLRSKCKVIMLAKKAHTKQQ